MLMQIACLVIRRVRRDLRTLIALYLLLSIAWGGNVWADQKIIILNSSGSHTYQQTAAALETQLSLKGLAKNYQVEYWPLDELKSQSANVLIDDQKDSGSFIVSIGSAAADYASKNYPNIPVISSYITRNAFEAITHGIPAKQPITAVFIDQPLTRLINTALLLKQQRPYYIGLLSQTDLPADNLIPAGFQIGEIEINTAKLVADKNPIKQIEPLMKISDVFIVRPNTSLFNRLVAKLVLQLSMRYKTPVIGFSENYAKAGALLSLFSSPMDIAKDTVAIIQQWTSGDNKVLPAPHEGRQFSVVINQRVARKLDFRLDAAQLKSQLQQGELE